MKIREINSLELPKKELAIFPQFDFPISETINDDRAFYNVSGQFFYTDLFGQNQPCQNIYGYIYYEENGWNYYGGFSTDVDGSFSFDIDKPYIHAFLMAGNISAQVITTESHNLGDGENVINYQFGVTIENYGYEDVIVPTSYTINNIFPAPFYIAEKIRDGAYEFYNYTGLFPSPCWVFWDSLNTQSTGSYFSDSYSINGVPIIYINSKDTVNNDYDWDEWDDPVILHEFSHYLTWYCLSYSPYAFGRHYLHTPGIDTTVGSTTNRIADLAYNEALANFLQAVMRNTDYYKDSVYNTQTQHAYWERPLPDAPWVFFSTYWGPSRQNPVYDGGHVEGAIDNCLWDIYDNIDDGNYDSNSVLYGHNNDYNSSSSWQGFDAIWDVILNYDPQPNNPDHENCWNIFEFIDGWRKLGYPVDTVFKNIFGSHYVPVFIPGDANNDELVNIRDITFLIAYVYQSGPEPEYKSSADINADCVTNMADITYLIEYLYQLLDAPLVGCVDDRYP